MNIGDNVEFFIIGTSKSKNTKIYYHSERWKIWGLLFFTKKISEYWKDLPTFEKNANQEFAIKNNFQFFDLVDEIYVNDSAIDIENNDIKKNLIKNSNTIINSPVRHLVFNGKTALHFFLIGLCADKTPKPRKILKKNWKYGELEIETNFTEAIQSLKEKTIYLAPNTSSRSSSFDEFAWIEILNKIPKK